MPNIHREFVNGVVFGALQEHENMAVLPILNGVVCGPNYALLGIALADGGLRVTEVSEGGSVPELKVVNSLEDPVLMLDGEELAGAKQNRVLNTTILLAGKTEAVIPVSCTEQGRWAYASEAFHDSGEVMPREVRRHKMQSVSESLAARASYESDQSEVWDGIESLHLAARTRSSTGAMRDAYEERREDLNAYLEAFAAVEGQRGCLVFIGGRAAGLDAVSRTEAYADLHGKLMRSYGMDALVRRDSPAGAPTTDAAQTFLDAIAECKERRFPSVGMGEDCRYEARNVVGSILDVDACAIHAAFFGVGGEENSRADDSRMVSYRRRREFHSGILDEDYLGETIMPESEEPPAEF